jgi:hypothetical protein
MSSQVKKSGECQLRDKKHPYFSIVSLPTDSVIVDHAVPLTCGPKILELRISNAVYGSSFFICTSKTMFGISSYVVSI